MPHRDSKLAQLRHRQALDYLEKGNLDRAAQPLKESLMADVGFGPAHNTLGAAYFHQQDYYLAAWEFTYAQKLMPDRPEPYNNLGLVYEALGRFDEAASYYHLAVELAPENPEYLGNLVRSRIRADDKSEFVREMLLQLLVIENRPHWRQWVEKRLATSRFEEHQWETACEVTGPEEIVPPSPPGGVLDGLQRLPQPVDPPSQLRQD